MARIRTIKPSFWSHEELSALPEATHILAAALLNYADDYGYFNANVGLIRAACTPLREPSISIPESLRSLQAMGYIRLGTAPDGKRYGQVVHFSAHQKVSHATDSNIATLSVVWDVSGITPEKPAKPPEPLRPEGNKEEEGNKESKGREGQGANKNSPDPATGDLSLAVVAWNALADELDFARVQRLTDTRSRGLKARLAECGGLPGWHAALEKIRASGFLNGTAPRGKGHENWRCTFDFVLQQRSFTKIMEGQFDDRPDASRADERSRENAAILEGLGIKPDQQRGADQRGKGQAAPSGDPGGAPPIDGGQPGNSRGGDSPAGGLREGVQGPDRRPESRDAGLPGSAGSSPARPAGGGVPKRADNPQMGHEAPAAERDPGRCGGPDGGAPNPAQQIADGATLPHRAAEPGSNGSGPQAGGGHARPLALQSGSGGNGAIIDPLAIPDSFKGAPQRLAVVAAKERAAS